MREAPFTYEIHGVVVKAQADVTLASAARIQALSLALRVVHPLLLAYATRTYGLESFGAFLVAQAATFVAARVALLGLDRALLVSAPFESRGIPFARAAINVLAASFACALVVGLFLFASTRGRDIAFIAVASSCVIPVALVELAANTAIARGRFTSTTLLRDTLSPILAIALVFLPFWPRTDGFAFVASFFVATSFTALMLTLPLLADTAIDRSTDRPLSRRVRRVARGSFVADGVSTLAQRLDVVVLALVAGPAVVGVYGVIAQFASTLRTMRSGIEPMVQKRVAEGDAVQRREVARTEISAAVKATLTLQLPLALAFILLRRPMLAFFGVHDIAAEHALVIWTLGHVLGTVIAFEVAVLHGRGRGLDVALALLVGALVQSALFYVLVPSFGVVGAALASAIAVPVPGFVAAHRRRAHERTRAPLLEQTSQEVPS